MIIEQFLQELDAGSRCVARGCVVADALRAAERNQELSTATFVTATNHAPAQNGIYGFAPREYREITRICEKK